jgi:hypothetical protein
MRPLGVTDPPVGLHSTKLTFPGLAQALRIKRPSVDSTGELEYDQLITSLAVTPVASIVIGGAHPPEEIKLLLSAKVPPAMTCGTFRKGLLLYEHLIVWVVESP